MATPRGPYRSALPGTESNNKCLAAIPARQFPPGAPIAGSLIYFKTRGMVGYTVKCEWLDIAYVTRELAAMRQSRCVSNKMIATMPKQIRTLDYRSGQHYMTVCGPNKYFVARMGR